MSAAVCPDCGAETDDPIAHECPELAKRYQQSDALTAFPGQRPTIHAALLAAMIDIGAIGKGRKMEDGPARYSYRSIEQILPAVHLAFTTYGIVAFPEVIHSDYGTVPTRSGGQMRQATLTVRWTFQAPDGSSVSAVVIGEALDTSDKASNKAMTAAWKYALVQVLCIPTEDAEDPDHESPQRDAGPRQQSTGKAPQKPPAKVEPAELPEGMVARRDANRELLAAFTALGLTDAEAKDAVKAAWKARHIGDGPIPRAILDEAIAKAAEPPPVDACEECGGPAGTHKGTCPRAPF